MKTKMKTINQIIITAATYGFNAIVDPHDKKTVWIWSDCDDIETAPNYDDLYCALGEFSNVDFQTEDDKMEVWIKG